MNTWLHTDTGEVLIEIHECLVTFPEINRTPIEGPVELMLPSIESVKELARELQSFIDAVSEVETPRVIDHTARG